MAEGLVQGEGFATDASMIKADAQRHRSCPGSADIDWVFAHLKRILKLGQLRLRGPSGAHDEFLLAATAQNLRRMAKKLLPPNLNMQPVMS
jgi:hypothetical protein